MIKPADFEVFRTMLYDKSGLVVSSDKGYLLESRLSPVVKKHGLTDLGGLADKIRANDKPIIEQVVEAMTTNETSFFRDQKPFDKFRDLVMPALLANKPVGSTIKIWSAACSSGQEPYTLAMTIKENAVKWGSYKFEILATDLSKDILAIAKAGQYSQFEIQRGMPITLLVKYFTQKGETWVIKDDIKNMVQFQPFNLLDSMDALGPFDVVFCRNVLIYFDQVSKGVILAKIHKRLAKHGFLFLGGAETVLGITDVFKPIAAERGVYVPHDTILKI